MITGAQPERRETPFTASAYRYVHLSGERIAVVWSEEGAVQWVKASDEFYRRVLPGKLQPETFAARLARGESVPDEWDKVPAAAWFEEKNMKGDAEILEHSKQLGRYGVLTPLWIDKQIENWREYDEENEWEV